MTRWGGTSVGAQFGLRTVCARCADQVDRLHEGAAGRCLLFAVGYLLSAYVGWQLVMNGAPGLGLICLIGVPPAAVALIAGAIGRSNIHQTAGEYTPSAKLLPEEEHAGASDARREDESVGDWVDRTLASNSELERRIVEGYAKHHPPKVGMALAAWIRSWPEWNPAWDPMSDVQREALRAGETLTSWATRIGARLAKYNSEDAGTQTANLLALALYRKPRVGEPLEDYQRRFGLWMERLDRGLDLSSAASAMRTGEDLEAWIERTAPLYLSVSDGDSIEDAIPKMVAIAAQQPPHGGESVLRWLDRVKATQ